MKNLVVVLGIIIIVGAIGLWLLPSRTTSTRNLTPENNNENKTTLQASTSTGPAAEKEEEPVDTLPHGSDAGMEFPVMDYADIKDTDAQ